LQTGVPSIDGVALGATSGAVGELPQAARVLIARAARKRRASFICGSDFALGGYSMS
jgi:hypothetical protein